MRALNGRVRNRYSTFSILVSKKEADEVSFSLLFTKYFCLPLIHITKLWFSSVSSPRVSEKTGHLVGTGFDLKVEGRTHHGVTREFEHVLCFQVFVLHRESSGTSDETSFVSFVG